MRSHLGGPAVRREWGEAETGLIWSMAGWFGTGSGCQGIVRGLSGDCQGIVRGLSGDCQGIVRGSSGDCQGIDLVDGCVCGHLRGDRQSCGHFRACSGSVNSFLFVGSGGGGGCIADMHCRYAPPICIADMVNRYARPENRKGQEHVALGP